MFNTFVGVFYFLILQHGNTIMSVHFLRTPWVRSNLRGSCKGQFRWQLCVPGPCISESPERVSHSPQLTGRSDGFTLSRNSPSYQPGGPLLFPTKQRSLCSMRKSLYQKKMGRRFFSLYTNTDQKFSGQYVLCLLSWWLSGKESSCQGRRRKFDPWVRKIPWRRKWQPIPIFLPGKSHGQRSLASYSSQGPKDEVTT